MIPLCIYLRIFFIHLSLCSFLRQTVNSNLDRVWRGCMISNVWCAMIRWWRKVLGLLRACKIYGMIVANKFHIWYGKYHLKYILLLYFLQLTQMANIIVTATMKESLISKPMEYSIRLTHILVFLAATTFRRLFQLSFCVRKIHTVLITGSAISAPLNRWRAH